MIGSQTTALALEPCGLHAGSRANLSMLHRLHEYDLPERGYKNPNYVVKSRVRYLPKVALTSVFWISVLRFVALENSVVGVSSWKPNSQNWVAFTCALSTKDYWNRVLVPRCLRVFETIFHFLDNDQVKTRR